MVHPRVATDSAENSRFVCMLSRSLLLLPLLKKEKQTIWTLFFKAVSPIIKTPTIPLSLTWGLGVVIYIKIDGPGSIS